MKFRSGFVSNSSTASFILVGVALTKEALKEKGLWDEEEGFWYEKFEKAELDFITAHDDEFEDDLQGVEVLVGVEMSVGTDEPIGEFDPDILREDARKKLKKFGFAPEDVKFFCGVRAT